MWMQQWFWWCCTLVIAIIMLNMNDNQQITHCRGDHFFEHSANVSLLNPGNIHTEKLCILEIHITAEISSLFWEQRCWDLGVLLWRRWYWLWWWTGHLCNLNVIHWKASPTQPMAFIWMCLQKIQLLFLSFYFFHPLISTLLPMH